MSMSHVLLGNPRMKSDVNSNAARRRSGTITITRKRSERILITTTRLQWRHTHTIPRYAAEHGNISML
jgi:hypothetical protein